VDIGFLNATIGVDGWLVLDYKTQCLDFIQVV
jgi:hypothetical protein